MKDRRIGATAVIAIVVVIAVTGVGGYLLLKGLGEGHLYPGVKGENLIWVPYDQRTGNTAGYYLKATRELTDNDLETLEQYGVYELYPTTNSVIYCGLIVEEEVITIEALSFVLDVYLPPTLV